VATRIQVPGYSEALAKEQQLREEAYLGNPSAVAGVRCYQITPRLLNLLVVLNSPCVMGGTITPNDAARFLWTLASDFPKTPKMGRWFANHYPSHLAKMGWDWEFVFDSITEFLEATFLDSPNGARSTPYVCSTAWIEVRMHKFLGWDSDRTLNTPLRRIYQLLRCEAIMDGDRTLVNRLSDKANDDWLHTAASDAALIAEIQKGGVKLN
jgi:hypothetical protein